jgi:hypothetical protein
MKIETGIVILWLLLGALAWAQMPPLPATNVVRSAKLFSQPRPAAPVMTNILISWDAYTNAWIEISGTTNLAGTNWSVITNVPVWMTNYSMPMKYPQQFFRTRTVFNGTLTNN